MDTLEIASARWAVYRVHSQLKHHFEPAFSIALGSTKKLDNHGQPQVFGESVLRDPSLQQLDTLHICNRLIQWSVEKAEHLLDVFDWRKVKGVFPPTDDETKPRKTYWETDSPAGQVSPCTLEVEEDTRTHVYARNSICKFVQQHAEHIVEFRSLVAHDLLSITENECSSVSVSIKALLESVKHMKLSEKATPQPAPNCGQDPALSGEKKSFQVQLESSDAKVLLCMEMLVALEKTLVKLFRSKSAQLPVTVGCVSSLCTLLRNEKWHCITQEVIGGDPRPLTLKCFVLVDSSFQPFQTKEATKRKGVKVYSHLDIVYIARNMFNHASFSSVSLELLAQWILSAQAMIQGFNPPNGIFDDAIAHLRQMHSAVSDSKKLLKVSLVAKDVGVTSDTFLPPTQVRSKVGKVVVRLMKKAPTKAFVGRQDVLEKLEQVASTIGPEPRVIVLSGHPGIGKSYAALQAAQSPTISTMFQMHFWITATTKELLLSGLVSLINASGTRLASFKMPMDNIISLTLEVCRQYSCYLVFDDVTHTTSNVVRQILASLDVQGMAVVTTCIKGLDVSSSSEHLDVEALSMEECFRLLQVITLGSTLPQAMTSVARLARMKLWEDISLNSTTVRRMVDTALGRSPLGVTLLGQLFVNEMDFHSVAEKISGFDDSAIATSKNKPVFAQRHFGLETTVRYLLSPIQEDKNLLSILYAISLMSPNGIPLRLLTNLGAKQRDPQSFLEEEIGALEKVGLVHATSDLLHEGGGTCVVIHQLTQRALRQVLPTDFGIIPLEVCGLIISGVRRDLRLEEFCSVVVGRFLVSTEEAIKWADCVLFSSLARVIVQSSLQPPPQYQHSFIVEMVDTLLLSCHLLTLLYHPHLQQIYDRLCRLAYEEDDDALPSFLEDIILRLDDDHTGPPHASDGAEREEALKELDKHGFQRVLSVCLEQQVSLEMVCYLLFKILFSVGKPLQLVPLHSAYASIIEAQPHARRPDLVNVYEGLIKGDLAYVQGLYETSGPNMIALLESQRTKLEPRQKYYTSAKQILQYYTASAFRHAGRYEEALDNLAAVRKDYFDSGNMLSWSFANSAMANVLIIMGRYAEALPILQNDLEYLKNLGGKGGANEQFVANAHGRLGRCLTHLGDFKGAEEHYLAFESLRAKFGFLDDIWTMWNMCWLYQRWGKYSIAWKLAQQRFLEIGSIAHGLEAYVTARAELLNTLYVFGPTRAKADLPREVWEDPDLRDNVRKCQRAPFTAIKAFADFSRMHSWMAKPLEAWQDVCDGLSLRESLQTDEHEELEKLWQFDVQLLAAARNALENKIDVNAIFRAYRKTDLRLAESQSSDSQNSMLMAVASSEREMETVLRRAWKNSQCLAKEALSKVDLGWQYEYAKLLLSVAESSDLHSLLALQICASRNGLEDVECSPQCLSKFSLVEEAADVLQGILSADVEETEWNQLAMQLSECDGNRS